MQRNEREWLAGVVMAVCLAGATPLVAASGEFAEAVPARARKGERKVDPRIAELRQQRVREHEKGNASEFTGKWKLRLPAGFEYAVELKANEDGLLAMTSRDGGLLLLGEFACKGTELFW
jgi:hypothetical protein